MVSRFRQVSRVILLALWFCYCVVRHYLALGLRGKSDWPRRFLGKSARITGFRVRVHGNLASRPVLILANHISWADIFLIGGATGSAFVAHDGLAKSRILRWACALNGTVMVARHKRFAAIGQVRDVHVALRNWGALTIFPEGTTGNGVGLLNFKSTLLAAAENLPSQVMVQPAWLDYGPGTQDIAWVDDEPGLANFMRILSGPPRRVTLHLLPVLSGSDLSSRKSMSMAAQMQIEATMQQHRQGLQ